MITQITTAAQEAAQIAKLMPPTYFHGAFYPVSYEGHDIKIGLTRGKGRLSNKHYLHLIKPCNRVLKSTTGEILDRWVGTIHFRIELHNEGAAWQEVS